MSAAELTQIVTVAGLFRISLPSFAKYDLVEGNSVMEIVLHGNCEPLYVKQYEYAAPMGFDSLRVALDQFVRLGIRTVAPDAIASPIESADANGALYAQVVCTLPGRERWIARAVARPGAKHYFLLHSIGSISYLKLVVAIFTEFHVLESNLA